MVHIVIYKNAVQVGVGWGFGFLEGSWLTLLSGYNDPTQFSSSFNPISPDFSG